MPEHKIELMMGLLTAIAQHDGGLLMVIDTTTKFIRSETVLAFLGQMRNRFGDQWLEESKKELCGSIVMTNYNNRTYKIGDLITGLDASTYTFEKGGRQITLVDYYKEHFDLTIRNPKAPLIESLPNARDIRAGKVQKIYLVPEFCQLTGLTDAMRRDFNLMRKVGDLSRHKPDDRVQKSEHFYWKTKCKRKREERYGRMEYSFQ